MNALKGGQGLQFGVQTVTMELELEGLCAKLGSSIQTEHYSQAAPGSTGLMPVSTESSPRELRGTARVESQVAESPLRSDPHNHVGCPEGNLLSYLVFVF